MPRAAWTPIALFSHGFRPFFLLAAAFAALALPLWLAALLGGYQPGGAFGAMQWHAHEMLFGFSVAVIAGFLLTAVSNWTGRETAVGVPLVALCVLWLLGRVGLFFAASLPRFLPALLDLGFLPALAAVCGRAIVATRNRRNYVFIAVLSLLALANAAFHFGELHQDLHWVRRGHRAALDLILLVIVLVTGRVVPMFTRNATQSQEIRALPALEGAAGAALALLLLVDVFAPSSPVSALLAALAGALSLLRMRHWGSALSIRDPLLWVLHLGALWLPFGLLLRAASAVWPSLPESSSLHALTAGAIGTLTLGMMARVSLGHTGRALRASWVVAVAFGLVVAAGLLRVLAPLLPVSTYLGALVVSGVAWSSAFALFFVVYVRSLSSPRVSSKVS